MSVARSAAKSLASATRSATRSAATSAASSATKDDKSSTDWVQDDTRNLTNSEKTKAFSMYNVTYGKIGTRFKSIDEIINCYTHCWMYSENKVPKAIIFTGQVNLVINLVYPCVIKNIKTFY